MLVMIAFLSRFWLDAKNSDLNDEVKQKQALILASKSFEDDFNITREKISIIATLLLSPKPSGNLNRIPPVVPEGVSLKSISMVKTGTLVDGESPSEGLIAQLLANLEGLGIYKEVNLNQVGSNQETGMVTFKVEVLEKVTEPTKTK